MYRPDTQTTLDIVYDVHIPTNLSHNDLELSLCDDIKQGLYSTERVLVDSLERLNQTHQGETSVVWEHTRKPNLIPVHVHLLSSPQRLIWNRLKNLHLIASDGWRNDYPHCIHALLNGGSLHKRVDRQAIIRQSGIGAWEKYQRFMYDTTSRLISSYGRYKNRIATSRLGDTTYEDIFIKQLVPYSELADLEMLSHILASPHERIVLFAGGAHCERIVEFLLANTTFQGVHSVVDADLKEISAYELELIAQDYVPHRRPYSISRPIKSFQAGIPNAHHKKPIKRSFEASCGHKASSKKTNTDSVRKDLIIGGALLLGWIWISSNNEYRKNPGSEWSGILKRKVLTGLQYGVLPAACAYLLMRGNALTNSE